MESQQLLWYDLYSMPHIQVYDHVVKLFVFVLVQNL